MTAGTADQHDSMTIAGVTDVEEWFVAFGATTVELTGFEPVTPSLRTRCSARLSYSPLREVELYRGVVCGPDRSF